MKGLLPKGRMQSLGTKDDVPGRGFLAVEGFNFSNPVSRKGSRKEGFQAHKIFFHQKKATQH